MAKKSEKPVKGLPAEGIGTDELDGVAGGLIKPDTGLVKPDYEP